MTKAQKAQKEQTALLIGLTNDLAEMLRNKADVIAHTAEADLSAFTLWLCLNNAIRTVRRELDAHEAEAKQIAAESASCM